MPRKQKGYRGYKGYEGYAAYQRMPKKKDPPSPKPRKAFPGGYLALAIAWVVLDQVVKFLVRGRIPYRTLVRFLPGMDLTYVKNTGAAFSMFSGFTWLLAAFSGAVSVLLLVLLVRDFLPHWRARLALALLLGGALGNFIDRLLLGYVTDMFATNFISFAVFNVADIGVVVGGILLCIHIFILWKNTPDGPKQEEEVEP